MKRPFVFPLLTAVILVMELAAWPAPGAGAADAVQAGWWTSSPVPAPDAPSGGLESDTTGGVESVAKPTVKMRSLLSYGGSTRNGLPDTSRTPAPIS